jgi:hypothetical protein
MASSDAAVLYLLRGCCRGMVLINFNTECTLFIQPLSVHYYDLLLFITYFPFHSNPVLFLRLFHPTPFHRCCSNLLFTPLTVGIYKVGNTCDNKTLKQLSTFGCHTLSCHYHLCAINISLHTHRKIGINIVLLDTCNYQVKG